MHEEIINHASLITYEGKPISVTILQAPSKASKIQLAAQHSQDHLFLIDNLPQKVTKAQLLDCLHAYNVYSVKILKIVQPDKGKSASEPYELHQVSGEQQTALHQICAASMDSSRHFDLDQLNSLAICLLGNRIHFSEFHGEWEGPVPAPVSLQYSGAAANGFKQDKSARNEIEFHFTKPTSRSYHISHDMIESYRDSFSLHNIGLHQL